MNREIHLLQSEPDSISHWLQRAEALHRMLRPDLPLEYEQYIRMMFREGARMAVLHEARVLKAIAVYRIHQTTFAGRRFYVDDLVTVEGERGKGYGGALLEWCEAVARKQSCDSFSLESGVQRGAAHRFYFTRRLTITTFGFTKRLSPGDIAPREGRTS